MGLPLQHYSRRVTASRGGEVVRTLEHYCHIERLEIGDATALDLRPPVMNLEYFEFHSDLLDGILGQDVLRNWAVMFDAAKGQLHLLPSDDLDRFLREYFDFEVEFLLLPMTYPDGTPTIEITYDESLSVPFTVDTGASMVSLPRAAIVALELEQVGAGEHHDIGGVTEKHYYLMPKFSLEKYTVNDVKVGDFPGDHGLLGYGVLKKFVFIVDGPGSQLWLTYLPEYEEKGDAKGDGAPR